MTRLAVVIADLGAGGAQRVVSTLAASWAGAGHAVSVITLSGTGEDFHRLPPGVDRVALDCLGASAGAMGGLAANLTRIRRLRAAIRRSEASVVVSFIAPTNVLTILATIGLGLRVVISERNDPARQSFGRLWDGLRRLAYPLATVVTANSQGALDSLAAFVPSRRLALVPNPLALDSGAVAASTRGPTILTVGRLHPQKAQDVLLRAFARVLPRHPGWRLAVIGEGALGVPLRQLADQLGIAASVDWLGRLDNPHPWYRAAELFALPSRHEGMPNALLEAMGWGRACIVSDASPGPLELIDHGGTGLVVPVDDADALAAALDRLMADEGLRRGLGTAAARRVEPYVRDAVQAWERVLFAPGT